MPFRKRAVLSVSREGGGAAELHGSVTVDAVPFDASTMLFRATWRPRAVIRTRPFQDWHIATLEGTGQQVGTLLDVENPPGVAWWGEGDEKIFVDGESFPSLFGTGTEDYFGYAWSQTETFAHAYHAQTRRARGRLRRPVFDEPLPGARPRPVRALAAFRSGDLALVGHVDRRRRDPLLVRPSRSPRRPPAPP